MQDEMIQNLLLKMIAFLVLPQVFFLPKFL